MRYFLDTEFHEREGRIDLISISLVSQDGDVYYAQHHEAFERASDDGTRTGIWLSENVLPHLRVGGGQTEWEISKEIVSFVGDEQPEFWADFAAYDWVVLCQIFGGMMELPGHWPMFCHDIQQFARQVGVDPSTLPSTHKPHDAYHDAMECRDRWRFIERARKSAL